MTTKTKIISAFFLMASILLISGCGCKPRNLHRYNLSLEIWGPFDRGDALREIFNAYKKINPNIRNISYKVIPRDSYKKELLDALASGQGPDIFLINNTWLPSFKDKIVSAPQVRPIINEKEFEDNFVDVATADFIDQGKIYAMPLSVDSLGLYYNKDLFNQAGIVSPPTNWDEFVQDAQKLTKIDNFNQIIQSGVALGTAYNINRSTDILSLLMLQNGTEMVDSKGNIKFSDSVFTKGKTIFPGENALSFYTQFANVGSPSYTWNPQMHYSIDAFSEGKTAMMFNYSWQRKTVAEKEPKLNFAVAEIPQFKNSPKINYANYWGFAVAKNKITQNENARANKRMPISSNDTRVKEAWAFLTYLTTKPSRFFVSALTGAKLSKVANPTFDPAKSYLKKTGEPAARRDIIETQKSDPKIGVFATGNLIAKSWRESYPDAIEGILASMINQVNRGQASVSDALSSAAQRAQALTR
ncbi:MAG TPA: extracellular solute-binding protein [Candidatus Moranbacteria bacterium]|nr:extracellular solute-binding protein [Candidatus Moranbacteria bacterium]